MIGEIELHCLNGCGELTSTLYEGFEIKTCTECESIWLKYKTLTNIVETEEETWTEFERKVSLTTAGQSGVPKEEIERVRFCPECKQPMQTINYQYSSGVIIDKCSQHGVWLDKGELEKIQIYKEHYKS